MMLIDQMNLNHLRVFEKVYKSGSMTDAAKELHLTQSGISQHVKSLEDLLGVKLFDRIKQRLMPTPAARILFEKCERGFYVLEQTLWQITGKEKEISGIVRVGMPREFGQNILLPKIAEFSKQNPLVQFRFTIDLASAISEKIIQGDLDYAFMDELGFDRRMHVEPVYQELWHLCISTKLFKQLESYKKDLKYYQKLPYIEYMEGEPVLRRWLSHHLNARHPELNVRYYVSDAGSIAQLILEQVGAGVLPDHLIAKGKYLKNQIYVYEANSKPLKNSINIAYLPERTHTRAIIASMEFLIKALRGKS